MPRTLTSLFALPTPCLLAFFFFSFFPFMAGICPLHSKLTQTNTTSLTLACWWFYGRSAPFCTVGTWIRSSARGGVHLYDLKEDLALSKEQPRNRAALPALTLLGQGLTKGSRWLTPVWHHAWPQSFLQQAHVVSLMGNGDFRSC